MRVREALKYFIIILYLIMVGLINFFIIITFKIIYLFLCIFYYCSILKEFEMILPSQISFKAHFEVSVFILNK